MKVTIPVLLAIEVNEPTSEAALQSARALFKGRGRSVKIVMTQKGNEAVLPARISRNKNCKPKK